MDAPASSNIHGSKASDAQDLENRLRNMIVSNQSKVPKQVSKEHHSANQPNQGLPPHMSGATQEQQQEYLHNRGNARSGSKRGSLQQQKGSARTDKGKQQNQERLSGSLSTMITAPDVNGSHVEIDSLPQNPISPSQAGAIPPHLRGAPREVQQQYLRNNAQSNKPKTPGASTPQKRTNQAERRKQHNEQNLLALADQPSPRSGPGLSNDRGLIDQTSFSPMDRGKSAHQPQSGVQGVPRLYNAVPPPPQFSQGFHPQPTAPSQQSYPNQSLHQSPVRLVNNQPYSWPDQSTGFGNFHHSDGRFQRGSHGSGGPQQYADQRFSRHADGHTRPQPQHHRLYEPNMRSSFNPNAYRKPAKLPDLLLTEQIRFLDALAAREIPNATMDAVDLAAKDCIRRILEVLFRDAVVDFERQKHENFAANRVRLECFGSISSGFATVGSDMDLALISPESVPNTASPESEIPRLLEKLLLDCGYGARLLTQTRVPIIKFCETPTPELREALLEKRAQWEKSLLEPAKPKKKKKKEPKPTKVVMSKAERAANRKKKKLLNRNKRWLKQNGVEIKPIKTDASHGGSETSELSPKAVPTLEGDRAVTEEEVESPPSDAASESDDSENDTAVEPGSDDKQAELQIEVPLNDADEVDATSETEDHEEKEEKDEEAKPNQPLSKYKAIMRSAEEMIRLYRLAFKEGWFNKEERIVINQFISVFEIPTTDPDILVHRHEAREALKDLPDVLSRYRDKPNDSLEFPKTGVGIQCDINFSNLLAVHNTALLRCYSLCDPRIQRMVIFVKAWAKRRKINTPYRGTLSSYGYVLMVLHYIVNVALPPLAPNLQCHPFAQGSQPVEVDGYDTRFWRDEQVIREAAYQRVLLIHRNEESLGSLLRGFFLYYAQQGSHIPNGGFNWSHDALSLRTEGGLLTKREKDWTGVKKTIIKATIAGQDDREICHRYLFAIEDPFEIDHNIARTVVHEGIVAIKDEFRRAYQIIEKAGIRADGNPWDLFEEAKELPSQRTYFGPKPRPKFFGPNNLAKALRPKDPYGLKGATEVKHPIGRDLTAGTKQEGEKSGGVASGGA